MQELVKAKDVGRYNPNSLVCYFLDKDTREVVKTHSLNLGKKKLRSIVGPRFNNHTVCQLNKHGFVEYDNGETIIRYEYFK